MTSERAIPLLHDFLSDSARRLPDKIALVCQTRRVTYRELDEASDRLAAFLHERGIVKGDRVLLFADNTVENVIGFWAVLKANAVASVVNPLTKADKLRYLLNDCRARALLTDRHLARVYEPAVEQSPHLALMIVCGHPAGEGAGSFPFAVTWDAAMAHEGARPRRLAIDVDLATIIYTSGSTGEPKGVMLTHRNMLTAAASVSECIGMVEDDVVMDVLPMAFNYGLYQMIMTFRVAGRLVMERSFAYPAQVLNTMVTERVTGFPGVPTIFAIFCEMKSLPEADLSSMRFFTNTAAPLPEKHIRFLRQTFRAAKVFSMYGLTECKRCTILPAEHVDTHPTSVGFAIPNTELWLVDDQDQKIGRGGIGQLVIRGGTVMKGYWEKPVETAEKLRPGPLPGEQVLYTGDFCRIDEEGFVYFVARMDSVIKSRGEKVAPQEVETAISHLEGVKEVAVIGVQDDVLGQAIKAFVVLSDDVRLTEKEVQQGCQAKLESYMVPKYVEFIAALPRTSTGKITKTGLS